MRKWMLLNFWFSYLVDWTVPGSMYDVKKQMNLVAMEFVLFISFLSFFIIFFTNFANKRSMFESKVPVSEAFQVL